MIAKQPPKSPTKKNQNKTNLNTKLIDYVKEIVENKIKIDMPDIVKKAIKNGTSGTLTCKL